MEQFQGSLQRKYCVDGNYAVLWTLYILIWQGRVQEQQQKQKVYHNKRAREQNFCVGDLVLLLNITYGPKWIPGHIVTLTGPLSYKVILGDGRVVRRHVDQIYTRQKLLVNTSEEGMDWKFHDFDIPENLTPVVAKDWGNWDWGRF